MPQIILIIFFIKILYIYYLLLIVKTNANQYPITLVKKIKDKNFLLKKKCNQHMKNDKLLFPTFNKLTP